MSVTFPSVDQLLDEISITGSYYYSQKRSRIREIFRLNSWVSNGHLSPLNCRPRTCE